MGSVFGKAKGNSKKNGVKGGQKTDITDKDRAVLELKNARDRLKKYRKKVIDIH